MKNYLISTIIGLLLFFSAKAQYEAGDIDFNLSGGGGGYAVSTNETDGSDSSAGAASGLIAFTGNYAVVERVSIGFNVERNGFVIGNDDSTVTNEDRYFTTMNYRLNTEFRLLNSEKNTMALSGLFGMFTLVFGDRSTSERATASGIAYEFRFTYKHFFGDHFGYFLNGGYAGYTYSAIKDEEGVTWKTSEDKDMIVKLSGGNIRMGFTYRI